MKVALLSDCYLPRLGGIEVQTHDLAAQPAGPRARGRGLHGHPGSARRAARRRRGRRRRAGAPDGAAAAVGAAGQPARAAGGPAPAAPGGFDVAHVHMGVVSPFATDLAGVALGIGLPTAITWHCLHGAVAPGVPPAGPRPPLGRAGGRAVGGLAVSLRRRCRPWWARTARSGCCPTASTPTAGRPRRTCCATRAARSRSSRRCGSPLASGRSPCSRWPRRARELLPPERRMRADDLRRGTGTTPAGEVRRQPRHGRLGAACLVGSPATSCARATGAATSTSRPARLEAFGIAALEARTAGLPVLGRRRHRRRRLRRRRRRRCARRRRRGPGRAVSCELVADDAPARSASPATTPRSPPRRRGRGRRARRGRVPPGRCRREQPRARRTAGPGRLGGVRSSWSTAPTPCASWRGSAGRVRSSGRGASRRRRLAGAAVRRRASPVADPSSAPVSDPVPAGTVPAGTVAADRCPRTRDWSSSPARLPQAYQRTAAYGVVTSERGVLLTELSGTDVVAGPVDPARRRSRPRRGAGRGPAPGGVGGERPAGGGRAAPRGAHLALDRSRAEPAAGGLPRHPHRVCRVVPRARPTPSSTTWAGRRSRCGGCGSRTSATTTWGGRSRPHM